MATHPEDTATKHRDEARTAAWRAAVGEDSTHWLRRHSQRLEDLATTADRLADTAARASTNAQQAHGEHLAELAATAQQAQCELYGIFLSITA